MEIRKIIDKWSTEKLSHTILYVMLAVTAVVFGLFYLIGYDRPFEENPQFTAPLLTNILLVFVALVFLLALALGIWTLAVSIRRRKGESGQWCARRKDYLWHRWFHGVTAGGDLLVRFFVCFIHQRCYL